jgi:repressor LexA
MSNTRSKELTERQADVYDFIKKFLSIHGFPPTVREIGSHFEININAVTGHLNALTSKGFVCRYENAARGIQILK